MSLLIAYSVLGGWGRAAGEPPAPPNREDALRKAAEFLWSQQADDGGWHSQQYAVMRSGQAFTPFILHTLLQVPATIYAPPHGGVERALEFIRKHVDEKGALGHTDPDIAEYPVYSTAHAVMCLRIAGAEDDVPLLGRMEKFLRSAQLNDANGFSPDDTVFGGWGFDTPPEPGKPGHMDLAHTRRAIQVLAKCAASDAHKRQVMRDAERFLKVVQKHFDAIRLQPYFTGEPTPADIEPFDGGFYFSPAVLAANKGREELEGAKYFRSYATATCDGILALLAAGVSLQDERLVHATNWLRAHDDLTYPQGVPTDHPEPWGEAIRFYHFAVRAEAYAELNWPGDWRARLAAVVAPHQAANGSFRNSASPLMKEDDPLLCTALATIALTQCRSGSSE